MGKTVKGFSTGAAVSSAYLLDGDEVGPQSLRAGLTTGADDAGRDDEHRGAAPRMEEDASASRGASAFSGRGGIGLPARRVARLSDGAQPAHHLLRVALRHLPDRPHHPDRSGARRGRRARQPGAIRSCATGARSRQAAHHTVRDLYRRRADRRFRQIAPDGPSRRRGHRPRLSRDARARHHRDADRGTFRHPRRRCRRDASGPLARPGHPLPQPDRLFRAGLLARPDRASDLLRQSRLGRRAGAPRRLLRAGLRVRRSPSHGADPGRLRRLPAPGTFSATPFGTSSCPPACSAISRSPTSRA